MMRMCWMRNGLAAALLALLLAAPVGAQKIYKWVDAQGRVQYTQRPPPNGENAVATDMVKQVVPAERREYCTAIRDLSYRLAELKARGLPVTTAGEAMRQIETDNQLDVDDVALQELVNYVYENARDGAYHVDVAGRVYDRCIGGSFGSHGEAKTAKTEPGASSSDGSMSANAGTVSGTGWVTHGYIATNNHVIDGKDRIRVRFPDGHEATAFRSEIDESNDVALLRVAGQLPPGLPFAASEAAIGAEVFTLGYPHTDIMGSNAKLSTGIINSTTGVRDDPRLYQISVPVQSGNSGGPLVNKRGEVVGLVTGKLSAAQVFQWTGDLPQNVNYAVKVAHLAQILDPEASVDNDLAPEDGSLEQLAARISPSVVLVIAE